MTKRIAVVTGGMGGIGTAICRALHDQGMHVVAAYSRKQEAAATWLAAEKKRDTISILPMSMSPITTPAKL